MYNTNKNKITQLLNFLLLLNHVHISCDIINLKLVSCILLLFFFVCLALNHNNLFILITNKRTKNRIAV